MRIRAWHLAFLRHTVYVWVPQVVSASLRIWISDHEFVMNWWRQCCEWLSADCARSSPKIVPAGTIWLFFPLHRPFFNTMLSFSKSTHMLTSLTTEQKRIRESKKKKIKKDYGIGRKDAYVQNSEARSSKANNDTYSYLNNDKIVRPGNYTCTITSDFDCHTSKLPRPQSTDRRDMKLISKNDEDWRKL